MQILIVEDDPCSRRLLEVVLQKLGYSVTACRDGVEAWEMFQKSPFPAVISDWMMPEMDGIELCRRIRRHRNPDECYFMMLTSKDNSSDYVEALQAGADGYMTKPLNSSKLRERLTAANIT